MQSSHGEPQLPAIRTYSLIITNKCKSTLPLEIIKKYKYTLHVLKVQAQKFIIPFLEEHPFWCLLSLKKCCVSGNSTDPIFPVNPPFFFGVKKTKSTDLELSCSLMWRFKILQKQMKQHGHGCDKFSIQWCHIRDSNTGRFQSPANLYFKKPTYRP